MTPVAHSVVVDTPSRHEVRRAIDDVMARPEFVEPEKSWFERMREEALDALGDLLGDAFSALADFVPEEGLARTLVIGWMVATLLAIIAHFIWTMMQLRRPPIAVTSEDGAADDPLLAIATAAEALARARDAAAAGRFDDAMAALYRGTVLWLGEQGEVTVEESKTGGDYARELRDADRRSAFRGLLRAYYPVAFGGRAATADGWAAMSDGARTIGVPTS